MKSLILVNKLSAIQRKLEDRADSLVFIQLSASAESYRIREYLLNRGNANEINAHELFRERRESFSKKYLKFIDRLNLSNKSLEWWGIPVTDKLPTGPDLCRDVAGFLLIVELSNIYSQILIVISDSAELGAQVKIWAKQKSIDAIIEIEHPRTLKSVLKYHSPAGVIAAFIKTIQSRWLPSRHFWPPENTNEEYVVVHSLTHISSFREPGFYRDAYFGPLVEHLATSGQNALILAGIQEQPQTQLKKLRELNGGLQVIPVESCVTFPTLVSIFIHALWWYIQPSKLKNTAEIDGLDVSYLVNNIIHESRHSGNLFMNLLVFKAAKRLSDTVPIRKWIYPFENLSWEKMLLIGAKASSKTIKMIGYQHASITKSNAIYQSMVLPEQPEQAMPFPDMIVTTGDVTYQWLEQEGHYPAGTSVRAACALRPAFVSSSVRKCRELPINNVLVALATNQDEYVRTLVFLEQAFSSTTRFNVRIRPHPVIPIEPALKAASLKSENFFHLSSGELQEDLKWSNIVLYASSTVGLEAISMGLPAINLDLGNFLDEDPMLGWSGFKWSVTDPSELIKTINQIESLTETDFQRLQNAGQEYAKTYLRPVTEENLAMFLND